MIEIYNVDCSSKRSQVEINPRTAQTYILMDYSNDNVHENMSDGIGMGFFLITIKQGKDDDERTNTALFIPLRAQWNSRAENS